MRPCPFGSKHSSMLSSKRTIPLDPRPQQTPGALLSRSLPNLVSGRRRCAGGRSVAAHVALQQAYAAPAGSRRVSGPAPASACCAAAGSAVNTPAADTSSTTTDDYRTVLQDLLVWLVNNGVTGVGQAGSKVALYQDEGGDRGIIAVEDISAGVELVRVPLRLAITDVMEDKQRSELVGQGALWQDRLVAKLLHEVQLGKQSAWYPYIRALPKSVPSALESFTASEALEVQFPAPVAAIQAHADKMATSWQACRPDAIYGADPKTYRWAHLCVMSRTFGNAAPGGGIGVHMMVPLIDMLNHAGDETQSGLLADEPVARDNARWDIISPANSPSNCWEMVLSSKQHIECGDPLLLSYFEGGNDEFLLHYGFVPDSNPHDGVKLFGNISEALEHLWWQDQAQGKSGAELSELYRQALDAGLAALQQEVEAAAGSDGADNWGRLLEELEPIKIASGSRVSNSLIAALEVLHSGDMAAVEAAVAALAWQQLTALPTTLLHDLALLVSDQIVPERLDLAHNSQDNQNMYSGLLLHYTQALLPGYYPQLQEQLQAAVAAAAVNTSDSSSSSSSTGHVEQQHWSCRAAAPPAASSTARRKKAVPGPPQPPAVGAAAAAAAGVPCNTEQQQQQPTALDLAHIPFSTLVATMLQMPPLQHQQQQRQQSAVSRGLQGPVLTAAHRTAVKYRVSKKMLLTDVILAARTPLAVLEQQQLSDKAAALRADWHEQQQQCDDGGSAELPWRQQ